jgi:ubiquinone/menaquinone biosynthesis C-methylase UbiE
VDLRVATVEQLPFPDASFDAVFDFGILHHVPAYSDDVNEAFRRCE